MKVHHSSDFQDFYEPASSARVSASTRVPFAMASGAAYSSGRWLTPPRQGIKIIPVGAMRDMKSESWYARLTMRL